MTAENGNGELRQLLGIKRAYRKDLASLEEQLKAQFERELAESKKTAEGEVPRERCRHRIRGTGAGTATSRKSLCRALPRNLNRQNVLNAIAPWIRPTSSAPSARFLSQRK